MKRGILLCVNQRVLIISLLATLFACQKNSTEPKLYDAAATQELSSSTTGNMIWQDNADGSSILNAYVTKQTYTSYGITASSEQVFNGTRSFRFELRDTDPENHSGTRAEIATPNATMNNLWYSYALYIPSAQYKPEADDEVITQWHGGGGVTPALCLRTRSDHMYLRIVGNIWIDLGALDKDRWHTYVFHIIHSSGSDGLTEIWRDGQKIVNRSGQNMYSLSLGSDYHLPQWKFGVYKSDWNGDRTTSTKLRVLYFDDIKYGNKYTTYQDIVPIGKTTTTNSLSISGFNLVNSATEKDVLTIANGQTISLSALNLERANIRVTVSGTAAKVKFDLSGKQMKTYTDEAAPFALHGDDGRGNFYYGNWNPPALGTYYLKAIPYDANGIVGIPKTISFTFVK